MSIYIETRRKALKLFLISLGHLISQCFINHVIFTSSFLYCELLESMDLCHGIERLVRCRVGYEPSGMTRIKQK